MESDLEVLSSLVKEKQLSLKMIEAFKKKHSELLGLERSVRREISMWDLMQFASQDNCKEREVALKSMFRLHKGEKSLYEDLRQSTKDELQKIEEYREL